MARTTKKDIGKLVNKLNYSSHSNYGYAEDSCGRHILRLQITSKQFRLGYLEIIFVWVKVILSILFFIEYRAHSWAWVLCATQILVKHILVMLILKSSSSQTCLMCAYVLLLLYFLKLQIFSFLKFDCSYNKGIPTATFIFDLLILDRLG